MSKCFFIFFIFIFSVSYGASFEIVDIKGVVDTLKDFDSELISDDYENMIEYTLNGENQILYVFYVDDLVVIQVGLSDEGPKFIAYK